MFDLAFIFHSSLGIPLEGTIAQLSVHTCFGYRTIATFFIDHQIVVGVCSLVRACSGIVHSAKEVHIEEHDLIFDRFDAPLPFFSSSFLLNLLAIAPVIIVANSEIGKRQVEIFKFHIENAIFGVLNSSDLLSKIICPFGIIIAPRSSVIFFSMRISHFDKLNFLAIIVQSLNTKHCVGMTRHKTEHCLSASSSHGPIILISFFNLSKEFIISLHISLVRNNWHVSQESEST